MSINNSCDFANPVGVTNGGTGVAALAADGVLYGKGTSAVGVTAVGTANYALISNGAGNAPTFQQASLTAGVTGILPIANGGTNASSFSTSNGVVKFDGTRLVASSAATYNASNVFNNTAQPCFRAYASTAQNAVTGDGTNYTIQFKTTSFDQASNFDGTSTFTAPVTGKYFFLVQCDLTGLSTSYTAASLLINGGQGANTYINPAYINISGTLIFNASSIMSLSATNTVTCSIQVSGSTKSINVATGSGYCYFCGYLIC